MFQKFLYIEFDQIQKNIEYIKKSRHEVVLKNAKHVDIDMKQPMSTDELVEELRQGNRVQIDSDQLDLARSFLNHENYYRFSIFPKLLPKYRPFLFSEVLDLYYFDEYLRSSLYLFSSLIETNLKSSLIKYFVDNYRSDEYEISQAYLDLGIYHRREWGEKIIQKFSETVEESQSPFIKHHKKYKQNCFPMWVLFEEITFGALDTFISQLNKSYLTNWISTTYEPTYKKSFVSWISNIRILRNKIAHNSRLYGSTIVANPSILNKDKYIFKKIMLDDQRSIDRSSTIFGSMYVIKKILYYGRPRDARRWNIFLNELDQSIRKHSEVIELNKIGFPDEWKELLEITTE